MKTGTTVILVLSLLLILSGVASAETYNYAGSDGDWQGQLTLTVNDDGSVLLNGASVVGGTIEDRHEKVPNAYGTEEGDCACQDLVMTGAQGYAGAGVLDANGNSAGTQVSFTNGNYVIVDQYAGIDTPSRSTEQYADGYALDFGGVMAGQHVKVGDNAKPFEGSYFETISASTSAHNADGSVVGVIAQATATDPIDDTKFNIWQNAHAMSFWPLDSSGSFTQLPFEFSNQAWQGGAIKDASSATIQGYASTSGFTTTGSISVVDGSLILRDKDSFYAVAGQESKIKVLGGRYPVTEAQVHADGIRVNGYSGGSNAFASYANGDSASATTSFTDLDLYYDLNTFGKLNDERSFVFAGTNMEPRHRGYGKPSVDGVSVTVNAQNSMGDSAGNTFTHYSREFGADAGIKRYTDETHHWAHYWPDERP
jgi:hypothetical protein